MKFLSECIADFYISKNIIKPDMKEIYMHGISLIINDIISFSSILIISSIMKNIFYGIIFLTVFYFTRVHCGGFHAKNVWVCRITMLVTFLSVVMLFFIINKQSSITTLFIINAISIITLLPIVPVENPNKKLTDIMRTRNKKQGIITAFLFAVLSLILDGIGIREGIIISLTLAAVAILAVWGKFINKRRDKENEVVR